MTVCPAPYCNDYAISETSFLKVALVSLTCIVVSRIDLRSYVILSGLGSGEDAFLLQARSED